MTFSGVDHHSPEGKWGSSAASLLIQKHPTATTEILGLGWAVTIPSPCMKITRRFDTNGFFTGKDVISHIAMLHNSGQEVNTAGGT